MSDVASLLKKIRKTTGSISFEESRYGEISDFIDTGCMSLNRILSGSLYKGIPSGKITIFAGESGVGKSLISGKIAKNAIEKHNYQHVFYFDSEGGALKDFFVNIGADVSKLEHSVVDSIEDATIKIMQTLDLINQYKESNPEHKFLLILDSLGMLVPTKQTTDILNKNKLAGDQGLRAKTMNQFMNGLVIPILRSDCPMIITNHVYDDPSSMYPSKIKNQSGGKKKDFAAQLIVQISRNLEKDSEKDSNVSYKGSVLKFFTTKNRVVQPFHEAYAYLDFSSGLHKYIGLHEVAIEAGLIDNSTQGFFTVPSVSDKKMRLKELYKSSEVWSEIIPKIDVWSQEKMAYGSLDEIPEDDMVDDIEIAGESIDT